MRRRGVQGAGAGTREVFRRVRAEARHFDGQTLVRTVWRKFAENDVLTYASAISFQVFFALIPLLLFALGLIGFLSLGEAWAKDIAPEIKPHVSGPMFEVIDDTVNQILGSKQLFWASIGAVIAVWEISGAVRAVMQIFNRVYDVTETRSFWRRMRISFGLAAVSAVCFITAAVVVRFGPLAVGALGGGGLLVDFVSFGVRWAIALALLITVVGVMVRFAPDCRRPLHWVSFGALVTVTGWALMTIGFWIYATQVADYGSIFASLATIIVTMTYLYASVIVFLTGVQMDALVQEGISTDEAPVVSTPWPESNGRSQAESSRSPAPPVASG